MKVVNSEQMQEIDNKTISSGVPSLKLMERAGSIFCETIISEFKIKKKDRISILVGSGNNGGDGLVAARILKSKGYKIKVFLTSSKIKGDALVNYKKLKNLKIFDISEKEKFEKEKKNIAQTDIFIDAIFGTGLKSPVTGILNEIINYVNQLNKLTASIDIPSGLLAGDFKIYNNVIRATITVSFGLPKIATVLYPAKDFVGKLIIKNIGFSDELLNDSKIKLNYLDEQEIGQLLPKRIKNSHKGDYGHLLVWAGSVGKTGAAYMTAVSAMRAGAGLVTVACPDNIYSILASKFVEIMTCPLHSDIKAAISQIEKLKFDAIALGPGLGTDENLLEILLFIITNYHCPVIIDADGLNLISLDTSILKKSTAKLILTPHYGEMSRLTKKSIEEIKSDKLNIATSYASQYNSIFILKGPDTIIASPAGDIFINSTGNPGLAKAGSGDVLTGILGGIVAQYTKQNLDLLDACKLSVFLHGKAADIACEKINLRSLIASDIINNISNVFKRYE